MDDAQVTVVGRLATKVELLPSKDETFVAKFRVAQTQRRRAADTGEWHDGETSFFQVYCYRQVATQVHASLAKGDPVIVQGRLQIESWDNGERSGHSVVIRANTVGANLQWDHIHVDRSGRRRKDDREAGENAGAEEQHSDHHGHGQIGASNADPTGDDAEIPLGVDTETGEVLHTQPLAG
ncbi:MAG TPA: single-stranded DNA-binding protein [Jiangellaceae bacterium]|nr:single-stranded DNA-binding protein [Jiangellaceae bacterium]